MRKNCSNLFWKSLNDYFNKMIINNFQLAPHRISTYTHTNTHTKVAPSMICVYQFLMFPVDFAHQSLGVLASLLPLYLWFEHWSINGDMKNGVRTKTNTCNLCVCASVFVCDCDSHDISNVVCHCVFVSLLACEFVCINRGCEINKRKWEAIVILL